MFRMMTTRLMAIGHTGRQTMGIEVTFTTIESLGNFSQIK